jgi:hypothetical protein
LFSGILSQVISYICEILMLDHMLTIEWTAAKGWSPARIIPYQNLSLDPATCVFHYAFECFEGMKAYKVEGNQVYAHERIKTTRQDYSDPTKI